MAASGDELKAILYLGIFGAVLLRIGFKKLKLRRRARALATSKARSMAMGAVELSGVVQYQTDIADPIFNKKCGYYHIKVEELRRSGKHSHWVTIHTDTSNGRGFFCKDNTGQVLIVPNNPELHFTNKYSASNNLFSSGTTTPEGIYLSRWGGMLKSLRLTAYILRENDPIYVLGCALPTQTNTHTKITQDPASGPSLSVAEMAKMLKSDTERMKKMDLNNDGQIDQEEWERGLAAYKKHLEEKRQRMNKAEPDKVEVINFSGMVTGTASASMVLANSEADVHDVGFLAFVSALGGIVATVAALVILFKVVFGHL